MKVYLISIGDELLLGQTINTNAAWLGTQLGLIGGEVVANMVIKDEGSDITHALDLALNSEANAVIITGGLGPTKDDITKHVLAEYFGMQLKMNEDVLQHVQGFFKRFNRPMLDVNSQQAMLPEGAVIFSNSQGTAPGMCFEKNAKSVISLPGVPYEMKAIMNDRGFDYLKDKFKLRSLYFQTIHTQGIGESFLADRIQTIESDLRGDGIALAYLPSPGQVRLRVSASDEPDYRLKIERYLEQIENELPEYCYGRNSVTLPEVVGRLLIKGNKTLGTVESCTSGGLAKAITSIPGSSEWFLGSYVTYSNVLKEQLVQVSSSDLNSHGAVSKEVVEAMCINGRSNLGVDYCVATSGIAGPDGGTYEKPVGTVWIGLCGPDFVFSKRFQFGNDRSRNIEISILTALNLLRCQLLGIYDSEK